MNLLFPSALVAVFAGIRAIVREYFDYCEPDDDEDPIHPPELDKEQVAEALDQSADERDLKWRTSIVDLLKLIRQPSGIKARRDLWTAVGKPDLYQGSAAQNIELHSLVIEKLRTGGLALP